MKKILEKLDLLIYWTRGLNARQRLNEWATIDQVCTVYSINYRRALLVLNAMGDEFKIKSNATSYVHVDAFMRQLAVDSSKTNKNKTPEQILAREILDNNIPEEMPIFDPVPRKKGRPEKNKGSMSHQQADELTNAHEDS